MVLQIPVDAATPARQALPLRLSFSATIRQRVFLRRLTPCSWRALQRYGLLLCAWFLLNAASGSDEQPGAAGSEQVSPGAVPGVSPKALPEGQQAAQELVTLLAGFSSLSFQFQEIRENASGRVIWSSSGLGQVSRPSLVRWQTLSPYDQLLVCDGHFVWLYDEDLAQVTKRILDPRVENSPALLLSGSPERLTESYQVAAESDGAKTRYRLDPIAPGNSFFNSLELETEDGLPALMRILDSLGQKTTVRFSNLEVNPPLDTDAFSFIPPEGTDILDETTESSGEP